MFCLIRVNPSEQEMMKSLKICKENFILAGTSCTSMRINEFLLFITCTSNLLQKVSKDSHDAILSFCISCFCGAFNRYSWSMHLCDFFQGFSEVHLNSDEQKILEFKKQKVDFWYLMTFLFVFFVVYRQMFYTKVYILNPIKPGLF